MKMKFQAKPATSQASNDVQSLIDLISALREENKLLRTSNKKLAKKARLAGTKNANMASTVNVLSSQLARATADQQQRRQELTRLNNACASYKQRIAALVSSSRSLASFPTADDIHPSPPTSDLPLSDDRPLSNQKTVGISIGTQTSPLDISHKAATIEPVIYEHHQIGVVVASPVTVDNNNMVDKCDFERMSLHIQSFADQKRSYAEQLARIENPNEITPEEMSIKTQSEADLLQLQSTADLLRRGNQLSASLKVNLERRKEQWKTAKLSAGTSFQ